MLHPPIDSSRKALPETIISRRVNPVRLDEESLADRVPDAISDLRGEYAWVLVGDPGSGKSTTFQDEAGQTGGCYLTVADFLDLPPDPSWRDGILFLDGFDEAQALEGRSTIRDLRKRLSALGYPRFRIACRAWDWRDATFREDLGRLAPGGLQVLALEPLQRDEILQILVGNHGIQDAEAFLERVAAAGFEGWLGNPLNLELLVKAQREGAFPASRAEAFRLGCESLAQEQNLRHAEALRDTPCSLEQILDAAGHLSAVILLANLHGVPALHGALEEYFELIYGRQVHPAHGESPIEHFNRRLLETGERCHRMVKFNRLFLIETCPAASGLGTREVDGQRGIKVDHIWYQTDQFRTHALDSKKLDVRVDPWNPGVVFVLIKNTWVECVSKYHLLLRHLTWVELRYVINELRTKLKARKLPLTQERIMAQLRLLDPKNFDPRLRVQQSEARQIYEALGTAAVNGAVDPSQDPFKRILPTLGNEDHLEPLVALPTQEFTDLPLEKDVVEAEIIPATKQHEEWDFDEDFGLV